jgi:hypothetical protein
MNSQQLQTRLEFWGEKFEVVKRALEVEMQKDHRLRNVKLLAFLYREKVICTTVLSELCALAEEAKTTSNALSNTALNK